VLWVSQTNYTNADTPWATACYRYKLNFCLLLKSFITALVCKQDIYLGVFLKAGTSLQFNFEPAKRKFYSSNILHKVGANKADIVLSLCNSFAVPMLLYGSEAMSLNKSQIIMLDNPFKRLFVKLFNVTDNNVIAYCQYDMNCLPLSYRITSRSCKFSSACKTSSFILLRTLSSNVSASVLGTGTLWKEFVRVNHLAINRYWTLIHYCCRK